MSWVRSAPVAVAVVMLAAGLAVVGCSSSSPDHSGSAATGSAGSGRVPAGPAAGCAVSRPSDSAERPTERLIRESGTDERWFGRRDLWVSLPVVPSRADPQPDGYAAKIGWWRLSAGRITLRASRLDGPGTAHPDIGGDRPRAGFQPSLIYFSQLGCWQVTGLLGRTRIDFVMWVE